jgi:uroporphyrinogen-III decarboxylase
MITGMDRLKAAIAGSPIDRIPVFSVMLDQGAKELGMSLRQYYSKGEYVAEAQLRMRAKYGYDNLWSLFYVGKEAELLGCRKIVYADDGPPNVGEMVIRRPEDIARLEVPASVEDHPAFAECAKCLRILRNEAAGQYPICAYLTASMTLPAILMGMEKWMEMVLVGPAELRDELLAKCSDFFRLQLEAYRKAGADIIVYSNPYGSTDIVPMKVLRSLSLPWMQRDLAGLSMDGMVYYCGGAGLFNALEIAASELDFKAFYLAPSDDIAASKRVIAGRGLTGAVINDAKLIDWSEAEIRAEVRRICEEGKPGGKFFFGTLLMPFRIPERNIRALFDAAREYGALRG